MSTAKELTAPGMAARSAVILFLFVIGFTAVLATVFSMTEPTIKASAAEEEMRTIKEVLPAALYDNDLLHDTVDLPATAELGQDDNSKVYRARLAGQPSALVLQAVAPDGYAGKIRLLLAVRNDGRLAGVRITQHKETPGLGDYIDPKKDKNKSRPWITQFDGLSFDTLGEKDWKVKKDGGHFDANAGATVTPRAVVKAVRKALKFANENRDRLFVSTAAK
ncbi:MAG: Electron transport complex, RnfABCDGE type, subunit [Proteobacteria bacterium]|nr:Electron transport complex, RnfABCDGE type, subunit [Pseudomonadota bacterium]